jgi:hypothetical protein
MSTIDINKILDDMEKKRKTESFFNNHFFTKQNPYYRQGDINDRPQPKVNNLLPIATLPIHHPDDFKSSRHWSLLNNLTNKE